MTVETPDDVIASGLRRRQLLDLLDLYWRDILRSKARLLLLLLPLALAVWLGGCLLALNRGIDAYVDWVMGQFLDVKRVLVTTPPLAAEKSWRVDGLRRAMTEIGATIAPRVGVNADLACDNRADPVMVYVESLESVDGRRLVEPFEGLPEWRSEDAAQMVLTPKFLRSQGGACDELELLWIPGNTASTKRFPVEIAGILEGDGGKPAVYAPADFVIALKVFADRDPASWLVDGTAKIARSDRNKTGYDDISVFARTKKRSDIEKVEKRLRALGYAFRSSLHAETARNIHRFANIALGAILLIACLQAFLLLSSAFASIYESRRQEILELRLLGIAMSWGILSCLLQALTLGVLGGLLGAFATQSVVSIAGWKMFQIEGHALLVGTFSSDLYLLLPGAVAAPLVASIATVVRMHRSNPVDVVNDSQP